MNSRRKSNGRNSTSTSKKYCDYFSFLHKRKPEVTHLLYTKPDPKYDSCSELTISKPKIPAITRKYCIKSKEMA
jgi:hypothetical protein